MPKHRLILSMIIACTISTGARADSALETLGNYTQVIVPAYAFGMAMNESDWTGAEQFALSFAMTEISVAGLKIFVKEDRPDHSDKKSFPSGHTAAAFSGATFIHKRYGLKRAIVPYILATFTGYTRIAEKRHHLHDVVAGAALSSLMTWAFVSKYGNVQIAAEPNGAKVNFSTKF